MSLFYNSIPSKSGPSLSYLAPRRLLNFLYPTESNISAQRPSKYRAPVQTSRCISDLYDSFEGLDRWFISSLVNAGHCQKHSHKLVPRSFFAEKRPHLRQESRASYVPRRSKHYKSQKYSKLGNAAESEVGDLLEPELPKLPELEKEEEDPALQPNRTKEELLDLVDQYSGESYTDQLPLLELPQLYQPSDGPYLTVSDKEEDEWPPLHYAWPADAETQAVMDTMNKLIHTQGRKDPDQLYQLYRQLPAPRAPYLESRMRHQFLHHLSVIESKDEQSMIRYLSVIDDMKGAAIPLSVTEWTSAISFVARYAAKSREEDCATALQMWKEMEHIAGVKGSSATFNVLFDVACKAGKFVLAEMIYKEMEARKLPADRFHHVSMIFYYGLQKSGDGARAAYKALVEAGEIVDTVVLNAMISALIRSHETSAAINIYERMKRSHLENADSKPAPSDFLMRRSITRKLQRMAMAAKKDPEKLEKYQSDSIIAPNLRTFKILVAHLAVDAGELDKTAQILEEMKWFGIPPDGALFLPLFKGFAKHGGIRYTHWTDARLEKVYEALINVVGSDDMDVQLTTWLIVWVLRAFAKCSGKSRTLAVWDEMKGKWKAEAWNLDLVMTDLRLILESPDQAIARYDFVRGSL